MRSADLGQVSQVSGSLLAVARKLPKISGSVAFARSSLQSRIAGSGVEYPSNDSGGGQVPGTPKNSVVCGVSFHPRGAQPRTGVPRNASAESRIECLAKLSLEHLDTCPRWY